MLMYALIGVVAIAGAAYLYKSMQNKETTTAPAGNTSTQAQDAVLKLGDLGAEVSTLQRLLGFDLRGQTGKYDEATEAKVLAVFGKKTISLREALSRYKDAISQ